MSEEEAKGDRPIDRRMVQENDFYGSQPQADSLLKGRTIQSESGDEGHVAITFDDESTLKLRVAGQATVSVGAKVEAVHEAGEHFQVDLEQNGKATKFRNIFFLRREDSSILLPNPAVCASQ